MADKDKPTQVMKATTRALLVGSWCFVLAGCVGRNDQVADSAAGPLVADSAAGLVSIDTMTGEMAFRDVNYRLTSDQFTRFVVAQDAIDALPNPPVVKRIDLRAPREEDVVLVVGQLEGDEPARSAIESAGLSVRDFVGTSLALDQALAFANDRTVVAQPANLLFVEDNRVAIDRLEGRRRFAIGTRDRMRIKIRYDVRGASARCAPPSCP